MLVRQIFKNAGSERQSETLPVTPRNTVGHGDCHTLLKRLPANSIDMVLTDPSNLAMSEGGQAVTSFNEASETILIEAFAEIYRITKTGRFVVVMCGKKAPADLKRILEASGFTLYQIVWMERRQFTIKTYINEGREYALVFAKGAPYRPFQSFRCPMPWYYSGNALHPLQTSTGILKPFIKSLSRKGEIVLDPFCGSGSTLSASKELGRCYLGIDKDGLYVKRARKRLSRR